MNAQTPPAWRDEQHREDDGHDSRADIGQGDHRFAADGVEQRPEDQGADEIAERPQDVEQRHLAGCDAVEPAQQRAEIEGHAVVEKRLPDEQRQTQGSRAAGRA